MPDINLLKDRIQDTHPDRKPNKAVPAPVEYSKPETFDAGPHLLRKPSGIGLWFRSLFRKKPPIPVPSPPMPVSTRKPPESPQPTATKAASEPTDIFADLPSITGGPDHSTTAPIMEPTRSGIPPLPPAARPPAWTPHPAPSMTPAPPPTLRPLTSSPQPPSIGTPTFRPEAPRPTIRPLAEDVARLEGTGGQILKSQVSKKRKRTSEDSLIGNYGNVNLLSEDLVVSFDPRSKLITAILVAIASVLLVAIAYVGLVLWQQTQIRKANEMKSSVAEVVRKIKILEKDQIAALKYRSSNRIIRDLLNSHVYWTRFLQKMEQHTLQEVSYPNGISLTINAPLSLNGIAPDIETINRQVDLYRSAKDLVSTVLVENIQRNKVKNVPVNSFTFVMQISFADNVLYNPVSTTSSDVNATTP